MYPSGLESKCEYIPLSESVNVIKPLPSTTQAWNEVGGDATIHLTSCDTFKRTHTQRTRSLLLNKHITAAINNSKFNGMMRRWPKVSVSPQPKPCLFQWC